MIYFFFIFLLLFFSFHFDVKGETKNKEFCYNLILFLLILIAGLRYRLGVDTTRYIYRFYHETPLLWKFSASDFSYGSDPLYTIFNSIVLSLGGRFYVVQLLHAAFVNVLLFKYVQKHSQYVFTCIFFYFIWMFCPFNMEEMRASMSVVICLFANDYVLDKKWVKALLLYLIGCFFHASTIIILLTPFLFFLRFNLFGVLFLISSFVVAGVLRPVLEDYMTILAVGDELEDKITGYVNSEEMMDRGLNIKGYIVKMFMYSYSIIALFYIKKKWPNSVLLKLESLLMLFLLFTLINFHITIVYRFVRFYFIYFVFYISYLSVNLFNPDKHLSRVVVAVRAFIILAPLVVFIASTRMGEDTYPRYHPYASVFEKSIDPKREKLFSNLGGAYMIHDEY